MDSKRLPGKPLLEKNGKTLLKHVYERAIQIRCLTCRPFVLSDSDEIFKHVTSLPDKDSWRMPPDDEIFGYKTPKLDNGTLRCAWFAENRRDINDDDIIVNIQVDEVDFDPENVSEAIGLFIADKNNLGTFCYQKEDHIEYDRNHVKASIACDGNILYFSREDISEDIHVGIYIYTVEMLKEYNRVYGYTRKVIKRENLEQMLFYELGTVFTAYYANPTFSINTEDDYNEWLRR